MKDFLKIFFILCGLVAAFLYGRSYGEETFKQSDEYRNFTKAKDEQSFAKSDIENAKAKLQNIIDSSDNKKSDEILGQILQVFLADLGLKIQNQKLLKDGTLAINPTPEPKANQEFVQPAKSSSEEREPKPKKEFDFKKLKSYEWILLNAQSPDDVAGNLKNVEIKNIDSYMSSAINTRPEDDALLFGSYRGRIMDVTGKEYGTVAFEMAPANEVGKKDEFKGSLKLFRNGKQTNTDNFSGTNIGYRFEGSSGIVINFGSNYYQMYKVPQTQQLAGYFYERLVNGTTKTIGSFVLNRVDQF